jgi:SlyX protein
MSSNSNPEHTEPRFAQIEERIAWLQRHVLEQDKAMLEMAQEITKLKTDLAVAQLRLAGVRGPGPSEGRNPADERPPHY